MPRLEAVVDCGGAQHRLAWAEGCLEPLDHADPEGERVLSSLGGSQPRCLRLIDCWRAHSKDPRVLALGPRHPGDKPAADQAAIETAANGNFAQTLNKMKGFRSRLASITDSSSPPLDEQERYLQNHLELLQLFMLPASLQHRLSVTVAAALIEEDGNQPTPALRAALTGRAVAALRSWAGLRAEIEVNLGAPATVSKVGYRIEGQLPAEWLVGVWGPGLEVVDDHFVVEAHELSQGEAVVTALHAEGSARVLQVSRADGRRPWHIKTP